jgi:hypothetical protein
MSAQVTILQLPAAGAITGTESVPIVQNGVTVQTTTAALAGSPVQTYSYLTVSQTPQLANSRYVGVTNGLVITDAGAQGLFNISTTGALLSLVNSGTGFQVKTSSTAITGRSITVSGTGLAIANGDGIAGNPTVSLDGQVANLANASLNGFVVLTSAGAITSTTLTGTANQIGITNPNGVGNPVFSIANDPVIPGTGSMTIPTGTTGQQPFGSDGQFRFNSTTQTFDGFSTGAWRQFSLSGGVTQVNTGTGLTGGPIVGIGTISIADTTVAAGAYGSSTQVGTFTVNAQGQLTAAANVTISATSIGAVTTINGTANEITSTGATTVTLSLPAALTFTGKTITGGSYTGASISGSTSTLTNIGNASLTNSSLTVGTTAIALGASSLTLGGLTSVTVTQDPTSALQLATKQYVDAVAQGLDPKASCIAATTADITLSGTQTIDGVALIAGDRCLVKDQTLSQNNGIYVVSASAWTRALDMDAWAEVPGAFTFVEQGTTWADTGWVCTSNAGGTLGTTPITWVQFAGVGSYTAGTGLTLTGTQFSITNTAVTAAAYGSATQVGTFTVNAQGQLTLAGNTTVTPAVGSITGLGTGVSTALAINLGSAGAFVTFDGALGTPSSGTVTNLTGTASININGTVGATTATTGAFTTISATGQISSTATGSATTGAGQIYLNGATSNRIDFNTNGTGAPAFTTRSAGTKLLLYPSLSGSVADYAMGIDAATMWSSIPENNASFKFKWYGAITEVASLDGAGAFTAVGGISGGTF